MRVFRHLVVCLVLALLVLPVASATSFVRHYEASSTYVWGDPSVGGAFFGTVLCNRHGDALTDTGACVRYYVPGTGGYDHRGGTFNVTLTDSVFGSSTRYLIGFDLNGDRFSDCNGQRGAAEPCYLGQGTITGTIPSSGDVMWIYPATIKSSGFTCCPQSFATRGQITIDLV